MTRRDTTPELALLPEEAEKANSGTASGQEVPRREHLILEHLPQVKLLARQFQKRLPTWVNLDDLEAAGVLGLLAAVDRYEPQRQVTLRTFAEHKIRSSILDSLRRLDWASREQRKRIRLLEQTMTRLEQRYQRLPSEEEIAAELGVTMAQYQVWRSECQDRSPESLDRAAVGHEGQSQGYSLADSAARCPSEWAERREQESSLRKAIEGMPERERTILRLYYYEERTLAEIAQVMNLHESRVSQLKVRAVQQLRSDLSGQKDHRPK